MTVFDDFASRSIRIKHIMRLVINDHDSFWQFVQQSISTSTLELQLGHKQRESRAKHLDAYDAQKLVKNYGSRSTPVEFIFRV